MFMTWIRKHIPLVIALAVVVVLAIGVISVIQYRIGVRNDGEAYQERIETLVGQARNSLSTCLDQGNVAAQVTQQEYQSIKDILTSVVSARYVDANGNGTSASEVLGGGQLFSALAENYPQIDQRSWQNLQTLVVGCRSEFQGKQDRVQTEANDFRTWMQTNSFWNSGILDEFPTDELKVIDPATSIELTGDAALTYLTRVITVEEANTAFETGTLDGQDLFGEN